MKSNDNIVIIIFFSFFITISLIYFVIAKIEMDRKREIINSVIHLSESCNSIYKTIPNNYIPLKGKVLIWDIESNGTGRANDLLPEAIRASSSSNQITVLLILSQTKCNYIPIPSNNIYGSYSITGMPAQPERMTLCVIYWPEKRLVGNFDIIALPPSSRSPTPDRSTTCGDSDKELVDLIEKHLM